LGSHGSNENVFAYFGGCYFIFMWANKSLHLVRTKKLINIKVRKMSILAENYTLLGQNRQKMGFSNLNVHTSKGVGSI
jgi:hypothetical protein